MLATLTGIPSRPKSTVNRPRIPTEINSPIFKTTRTHHHCPIFLVFPIQSNFVFPVPFIVV